MRAELEEFLIKTKVLIPLPYENYFITKRGEIYSRKMNKTLTPYHRNGYNRVRLCINSKCIDIGVHRLIGMAFVPGQFDGAVINHINGIKNDNRIENLEWTTQKRNAQLAINKPLKVTTKSGVELYYDSCLSLASDLLPSPSTSNLAKHIKENSGRIRKYGLKVEYLEKGNAL